MYTTYIYIKNLYSMPQVSHELLYNKKKCEEEKIFYTLQKKYIFS